MIYVIFMFFFSFLLRQQLKQIRDSKIEYFGGTNFDYVLKSF